MNRDNNNPITLNTPSLSNNIQNYDYLKQKRESFLAPTPSYKPDFPLNPQNQEQKIPSTDYIKDPGSSQYIDLIHHPSNTIFGGNALFGIPQSPAYPNQASVNYFMGVSASPYNTTIPNNTQNVSGVDPNTSNNVMNNSMVGIAPQSIKSEAVKKADGISISGQAPSSYGILSELDEEIRPKLQNIVSTANLKCHLDLRQIALKAKNAEYNPKRFAAVIMRIKEPKTTALIFSSGKMVCTGARSEEDSKKAARQYAKIIRKLGYEVSFSEFKIQNIVGSCDVKFQISLEGLSTVSKFSSYEPEIFPGLIFKMAKPKIVLLIFVSGKIVLTGAKKREEIFEAFRQIYPLLQKYKKKLTLEKTNDATPDNVKSGEHENK